MLTPALAKSTSPFVGCPGNDGTVLSPGAAATGDDYSAEVASQILSEGGNDVDATLTAAMLDRLPHHAHVVPIQGDSFRLRAVSRLWCATVNRAAPNIASSVRKRSGMRIFSTG
jgi:hypothetical protein